MIDKNPATDSLGTYLYAIGLAVLGGLVKYMNNTDRFKAWTLLRDLITAGFCGLLTFWMCEWMNIVGPLSAILIAASGLMGTRLLKEVENIYRIRMGLQPKTPLEEIMERDFADHEPPNTGESSKGE
jgi:hypothetical protein